MKLLLRLVGNAIALYVASTLIDGIQFGAGGEVDFGSLLAVTLIFGVVNAIIKPVVKVVTCPAFLVTLGLFTFVVNALMLLLTGWLAGILNVDFQVDGFGAAFLGAIVISFVSFLLSLFVSAEKDDKD
ncbi:MAG: phage holin family protein [Caldilineaceae bacterium SB0670_bin_27]|uniref:Phage holin family protein n=1 Tax=Caldilineaceae bacterium SB0664_bin_27 TaxID=2605260 RepID=A0A6B0YRA0_9CHLR|nr:phage holin family protein [Caldilineaceae bacterium SB0664_bin_27]MYJ78281.1 phage holin family protein [Caldilineaceae bacterium SB0670_bin_27]